MVSDSLWLPRSDCGRHCLPGPGTWPVADPVRRALRSAGVFLLLLAAAVAGLPLLLLAWGAAKPLVGRLFARALLRVLGVRHSLTGRLPRRPALVVANHVSWLDVLVLMAHLPVRLLAKREVRGWPVVGALAAGVGTLFIDRTSPRALPGAVADVAAVLRTGTVVALFPEATTFCGSDGGSFRPAMFQAAIDAGAVIAPVSLRFRLPGERSTTVAAFVGEERLLSSMARVASVRGLTVSVRLHDVLHPDADADRRVLARAAHATVGRDTGPAEHPALLR